MVRTQIQLTEEQARALKELAAEEGVSMAELIRRSVEYTIKAREETKSGERRLWPSGNSFRANGCCRKPR